MRPPDLEAKAAAWVLPVKDPKNRLHSNWRPDFEGTICGYLLHCTWSHPFWSWYLISAIHLRPIPGVKDPHKSYPEAEYEITILSIDPDHNPDPDKFMDGYPWLMPIDLVHQFHGINDKQVEQLMQMMILEIVEGRASPDQDFRSWWRESIDEIVKYLREGKHKLQ